MLEFAAAFVGVLLGALVQGTLGFGIAFVAVPLVSLVRVDAVPATMLLLGTTVAALVLLRDRSDIDGPGLLWSTLGRFPGTAAGAALLMAMPSEGLTVVIGSTIVLAVLISAAAPPIPGGLGVYTVAGFLSGLMGTVSAIGGPPLAVTFQHRPGSQIRSTISANLLFGGFLSLGALWIAGRFHAWHLLLFLQLLPAMMLGYWLSGRLSAYLRGRWLRLSILGFAGAAGLMAILRGLNG